MASCPRCGNTITDRELVAGEHVEGLTACGERFPPPQTPAHEAAAAAYGWRLTLPNHLRLPLVNGSYAVGRSSRGVLGDSLRLFGQVSKHHLTLEVATDILRVYVLPEKNPVFTQPAGDSVDRAQLGLTELLPGEPVVLRAGDGDAVTLLIAQCCFLKIDRGEA